MHLELNSDLQKIEFILLNFTGILDVLANTLLIYLVLYRSSNMQSFRFYLLYLQLDTLAVDVFLTFFMKPIPIFPVIGGYTTGFLFTYFQISSHLQMTIVMGLMALQECAIFTAFIRKHQSIASIDLKRVLRTSTYWSVIVSVHVVGMISVVLFYFADISREAEINWIKRNLPELLDPLSKLQGLEIYDPNQNILILYSLIGLLILNILFFIAIFAFSFDIFWIINHHKPGISSSVSAQNLRKHQAIFRSLLAQFSVLGLCFLPVTAVLVFLIFEIPDIQVLSAAMVCTFSFHSFLGSVVLMATYTPYRKIIIGFWSKPKLVKVVDSNGFIR